MRATITIKGSKGATIALVRYCLSPTRERAKAVGLKQAKRERVLAAFSYDLNASERQDHKSISKALEHRAKTLCARKGKMHRHVIFSVVGEESREKAVAALRKLAADWRRTFCPQSKVVFVVHGDGSKIHMHAIVEAYNPVAYKRLDWDQRKTGVLSKMQDMQYTSALISGKNHKLTKSEQKHYQSQQTKHSQNVTQAKKQRKVKDSELAQTLVAHVKKESRQAPKSEDDLLSILKMHLPSGWSLNDKTSKGKPRAHPVISNGKTKVRLGRFWKWITQKRESKKKDKCPTCGAAPSKCSCSGLTM